MSAIQDLQNAAFEMIADASSARSMYQKAIKEASKGGFSNTGDLIARGNEKLAEGSSKHFAFLQEEAQGNQLPYSIVFMHAEDQLAMTEIQRDDAIRTVELYRQIYELKGITR